MGTRVVGLGAIQYTVWVNTEEVTPRYSEEARAIARGEREAATHHHVQVTRQTGQLRPRSIATWVDGRRQ